MDRPWGNQFGIVWTDDQDAALRKHLFDGLSSSVAANAINKEFGTNYTRNSVIGRACRNNIPRGQRLKVPRPLTPWQLEGISERTYRRRKSEPLKPKPKPRPVKIVPMQCVEVTPRHVPFAKLKPHHCRFPYGEGPFTFCGRKKFNYPDGESPYCEFHHALCFLHRRAA